MNSNLSTIPCFCPPVGEGGACGKIWIELQKETNVGLAQTLYDP